MKKLTFKSIWKVLKDAIQGFSDDRVTKLGASLSYATLFSLAPMFIVAIHIAGYFVGNQEVENELLVFLSDAFGSKVALQISTIIENYDYESKKGLQFYIGVGTMLFGATTVFAEIQSSLNIIWGIKPKPKRGWLKMIINRLLSFSIVISIGFILLVSLFLSSFIDLFSDQLSTFLNIESIWVASTISVIINFVVVVVLFLLIFKILPDAKIKYKDVLIGSVTTGILFIIGRYFISLYLSNSTMIDRFGSAGSVVLVLIWVYYSSFIIYFGAEFTKSWAINLGGKIYPDEYAVTTKLVEVEKNDPVKAVNKEKIDETVDEKGS